MIIKDKVIIYTNDNCDYCRVLKEELTKNNIKFSERLITKWTEAWAETVGLTNMPITPTIHYKDNYFMAGRDFSNQTNLIKILESFKPSTFDDSKQILERIKTLNYNMSVAFGRLDQLLKQIETKINTDEYKSTN